MFKRMESRHGQIAYGYTYDHNEGLIAVFKGYPTLKTGFIYLKKGNEPTPLKYEKAYYLSDGYAMVQIDEKSALVNINDGGKELTPFIYDWINPCPRKKDVFEVTLNGEKGFIDKQGNKISG